MNDNADVSDEGFDDGFSAPTATPGPEAKPETEQESPAQVVQEAIEYAQLTKAELEELRSRAALAEELKATHDKSFGTAFGKIGGLERQLKAMTESGVEIDQADIDQLRDDGLEPLARALERIKSLRAIPAGGVDQSAIESMVQERLTPALQKVEVRLLAKDHPDWREIDADPEFAKFNASQGPEFMERLAKASREYDSEVISEAMTKFKQSRKPVPPKGPDTTRKSRIAAAVTPTGSGMQAAPDPNAEFDAGFRGG